MAWGDRENPTPELLANKMPLVRRRLDRRCEPREVSGAVRGITPRFRRKRRERARLGQRRQQLMNVSWVGSCAYDGDRPFVRIPGALPIPEATPDFMLTIWVNSQITQRTYPDAVRHLFGRRVGLDANRHDNLLISLKSQGSILEAQ